MSTLIAKLQVHFSVHVYEVEGSLVTDIGEEVQYRTLSWFTVFMLLCIDEESRLHWQGKLDEAFD